MIPAKVCIVLDEWRDHCALYTAFVYDPAVSEWRPSRTYPSRAVCRVGCVLPRQQMFLRSGVAVLKTDFVCAAEICRVKKSRTSKLPSATCTVAGYHLADPDIDLHAKRRTPRGIEDALHNIKNARRGSSWRVHFRELGVVAPGDGVNRFRLCIPWHIPFTRFQLTASTKMH